MNVYIRLAEHVKKRRHTNFHSGSSVDVFSTSAKTSKRRLLDVTLPSGKLQCSIQTIHRFKLLQRFQKIL